MTTVTASSPPPVSTQLTGRRQQAQEQSSRGPCNRNPVLCEILTDLLLPHVNPTTEVKQPCQPCSAIWRLITSTLVRLLSSPRLCLLENYFPVGLRSQDLAPAQAQGTTLTHSEHCTLNKLPCRDPCLINHYQLSAMGPGQIFALLHTLVRLFSCTKSEVLGSAAGVTLLTSTGHFIAPTWEF